MSEDGNALRSFDRQFVVWRELFAVGAAAQEPAVTPSAAAQPDPIIKSLVDRLDLEKYKATIKGLTQFGDRRQGTDRNKAALDWIEAQLKSYGCTNTERITYTYPSAAASDPDAPARAEPVLVHAADVDAAVKRVRQDRPPATIRDADVKAAARSLARGRVRVSISRPLLARRHSIRGCRH